MNKKVYTAEEYKKMMQKHKKKNAKAKIKARTKGQGLSNDVKCKIVTAIGVAVIAGSIIGGLFFLSKVAKKILTDSENEPERVYEQDAFLPAGYFNEHPIKIAVSNDFSKKEFKVIESAINKLDGYAEGIKFEIVRTSLKTRKDGEQIIVLKDTDNYLESVDKYCIGLAKDMKKNKTKPEDYCGTVLLKDDVSSKPLKYQSVAMHEILHILGFKHENDCNSIMYPSYVIFKNEPTKKDIENINTKFPDREY